MPQHPPIKIYSTATCGYCAAARQLLKKKGLNFEDVRVDLQPEFRAEMAAQSGSRTVPQIFIDGTAIGGYDDMAQLEASGELDTMLGR